MKGLKHFMTWKKNPKHLIKQASQEIQYLAKRILELGSKPQDKATIQVLFLAGLPKEFDNACQILELQAKSFTQIVESLVTAKASMGGPDMTGLDEKSANWSQDLE